MNAGKEEEDNMDEVSGWKMIGIGMKGKEKRCEEGIRIRSLRTDVFEDEK